MTSLDIGSVLGRQRHLSHASKASAASAELTPEAIAELDRIYGDTAGDAVKNPDIVGLKAVVTKMPESGREQDILRVLDRALPKTAAGNGFSMQTAETKRAHALGQNFARTGDTTGIEQWSWELGVSPEQSYAFTKGVQESAKDPVGRLAGLSSDTLENLNHGLGYLHADAKTPDALAKFGRFAKAWKDLGVKGEGPNSAITKEQDLALRKKLLPHSELVTKAIEAKRNPVASGPIEYSAAQVMKNLNQKGLEVAHANKASGELTVQWGMSFGGGSMMAMHKRGENIHVADSVFKPGDPGYAQIREAFDRNIQRKPSNIRY